ncbi:hypothetical protein EVAR_102289_1 [Eumeta japonica]|uniref:Uncharacterized protein n=1 Tax=Eumeta variegata TaxID=151549 RepID=A0A4C1WHI1_EUMVA|nr:hypothetical protein EVAR_102289_1 [Eumeta japonica]
MYLLMSLVSVKNTSKETNIIHVLVSGIDTGFVGSLICEAAKLAERSVLLGSAYNTSVSATLINSSGGVCVMPFPFDMYSQKQINFIRSAIESNEVATESGVMQLNSSVWAQGTNLKKTSLFNVSNVFGSICRGDYGDYEDEMIDFMLENTIKNSISSQINNAYQIKLYLELVIGFNVYLNDKAKEILKGYFVTVRMVNPKILGAGGMITLMSVCASSAKLCRRDVASVDDAIFAVWLHAASTPGMQSVPNEYIEPPRDTKKFHEMMIEFKMWLENFTGLSF